MADPGTIEIIWHEDGSRTVDGDPPRFVSWQPPLLDEIRAGNCAPWCTLDGDTIIMRLCPVTLRYRLTGETDIAGGIVAERVDEEGRVWLP